MSKSSEIYRIKIEGKNGYDYESKDKPIFAAANKMIDELVSIGAIPDNRNIKKITIELQEQDNE